MRQWYSKNLGDGMKAFTPSEQIQEAYLALAMQQKDINSNVAVFSQDDFETNSIIVYFTPESKTLASIFDATPCDKPDPQNNLSLLVGTAESWNIHFPNRR